MKELLLIKKSTHYATIYRVCSGIERMTPFHPPPFRCCTQIQCLDIYKYDVRQRLISTVNRMNETENETGKTKDPK